MVTSFLQLEKVLENIQFHVGQVTSEKDNKNYPIIYAENIKYPFTVKIFIVKKYIIEITSKEHYQTLVDWFRKEILNNDTIDPKYKIFDPDQRIEFEKRLLNKTEESPKVENTIKEVESKNEKITNLDITDEELDQEIDKVIIDILYAYVNK